MPTLTLGNILIFCFKFKINNLQAEIQVFKKEMEYDQMASKLVKSRENDQNIYLHKFVGNGA
jgi:hypothetical protein